MAKPHPHIPLRLLMTKDQSEFLNAKLPPSYALLPIKVRYQSSLRLQDLIDFEKGGYYSTEA